MPFHNNFRHQEYSTPRPESLGRLLRAEMVVDPAVRRDQLAAFGQRLDRAGVAGIYLIHGTFVGNDALGLIRDLARVWPAAGELLHRWHKQSIDRVIGEVGNYTEKFASDMQEGLNASFERTRIPVQLFHWSSENHHLGRVEAALRLIEWLNAEPVESGKRWLLWGHSHGGNLLALLTNLLGADDAVRERLFAATRCYYRWPWVGWIDRAVWPRVRDLLRDPQLPLRQKTLDLVTFGTPIRYGWDTGGYAKLLHFVHHRPVPGRPANVGAFPPTVDQVLKAQYGDYIQQLALAGTNIWPSVMQCGALLAELRLSRILQPHQSFRSLLRNLNFGVRTADEGTTLLVDYQSDPESLRAQLLGHAVYTRPEWLPFHLEQTLERLYATHSS